MILVGKTWTVSKVTTEVLGQWSRASQVVFSSVHPVKEKTLLVCFRVSKDASIELARSYKC